MNLEEDADIPDVGQKDQDGRTFIDFHVERFLEVLQKFELVEGIYDNAYKVKIRMWDADECNYVNDHVGQYVMEIK